MKAALWDGKGLLEVCDIDKPSIGPQDALVKVKSAGICGSDLLIYSDKNQPETLPQGHEIAGEVVEVGLDVDKKLIGSRVAVEGIGHGKACSNCYYCNDGQYFLCENLGIERGGGYAEYVTVAARQCQILPDGVNVTDAALAEPLAVALHCVVRSGMKVGDSVAILGAGPIGLLVAFWARRMGASHVVMADLHDHQAERARALGATGFALSGDKLSENLADLCGGPPDIVFECVGKPGLLQAATEAVKLQGKVIGVGLCVGGDSWDPFVALSKEIDLIFSVFFHQRNEFGIALDALAEFREKLLILTCPGEMGATAAEQAGLRSTIISSIKREETTAEDTRAAASKMLEYDPEMVLFVGGGNIDRVDTVIRKERIQIREAVGNTVLTGIRLAAGRIRTQDGLDVGILRADRIDHVTRRNSACTDKGPTHPFLPNNSLFWNVPIS